MIRRWVLLLPLVAFSPWLLARIIAPLGKRLIDRSCVCQMENYNVGSRDANDDGLVLFFDNEYKEILSEHTLLSG